MQKDKYIMLRTYSGETNYTKYLPVHCKSLPHVCRLIDEYLVDSINPQVLQDACEHGASSDDLEFIRKRTAPKWTNVVKAAARGGYLHVFEWMLERQDGCCPWEVDLRDVLAEAAAHGHLELMKWLYSRDENTTQRGSEWGLGAVAKEGYAKVAIALMRRHSGIFRRGMYSCFLRLLNQLSNEGDTPASPLWNELLRMLEIFHSDECSAGVITLLDLALQRGYLVMARQFFDRRSEQEKCQYVAIAADHNNIVLMRWMIENGAPLSVHTAISLASSHVIDRRYVEVTWWLSESDRVVVIRIALENNVRKLLLWVLHNTVFEDVTSRNAIRSALTRADNVTAHWLCDYLSNDDTRSWCFPLHQEKSSAGTQFTRAASADRS
ncbi:unnamed protein product [Peronospora farinosa]|uniref:Ankyrin repeat-containing domain n=1 Tax=Peronospora farinosa TaxID=134698 RepID=A0ABN8CE43_9STRA|nr:unnamed protein product [Peronospora farinosa]